MYGKEGENIFHHLCRGVGRLPTGNCPSIERDGRITTKLKDERFLFLFKRKKLDELEWIR